MKILRMVPAAESLFREGVTGRVHSAYRNTVNIEAEGRLFGLHPASLPLTPLSMAVDRFAPGFAPKRGDLVRFNRDTLTIGRFRIALERPEVWNPMLAVGSICVDALAEPLRECLAANRDRDGFGDSAVNREPVGELISDVLRDGLWAVHDAQTIPERVSAATSLMGMGLGLTPSGDDFLVGYLLALSLTHQEEERQALSARLLSQMDRTNDLSAEFLRRAVLGEFSESLHKLVKAPTGETALSVARTGHSSGVDTLNGLYCGLCIHVHM